MKEYILCAAIWYKDCPLGLYGPKNIDRGIVLCGHRHPGIIHQHVTLLGKSAFQMGDNEQGFLTSTNRFVDRTEAYQIAVSKGQVVKDSSSGKKELFSEDLY